MREITVGELERHHLFLASPQFGGQCSTIFARGLADLAILATRYHLALSTCFFTNESLVTRARNYCVATFLETKASHLLFVDADIGFRAQDAMELLILQVQHPEYEIIGGPYRTKDVTVRRYAFDYGKPFDMNANEPVEVSGIGTGFMLIHRSVFERFDAAFPQYRYEPDSDIEGRFSYGHGNSVMQYFQAEIDPATKRYLSEDYWFSKRCNEIGIRTWLCPWMKLRHAGTHIFE